MDESVPIRGWRDVVLTIDRMDELRYEEQAGADMAAVRRTLAAASWLVAIAETGERHGGDLAAARWLNRVVQRFYALQGELAQ